MEKKEGLDSRNLKNHLIKPLLLFTLLTLFILVQAKPISSEDLSLDLSANLSANTKIFTPNFIIGLILFIVTIILMVYILQYRIKSGKYSIQLKLLFAFLFQLIIILILIISTFILNQRIINDTESIKFIENPLEIMASKVLGYDAILTGNVHYALLHAEIGEYGKLSEHISQYDEAGIALDSLLKYDAPELIKRSSRSETDKQKAYDILNRLDEINLILVELEKLAFIAIENRDLELAYSFVLSEEYEARKIELALLTNEWIEIENQISNFYRARVLENSSLVEIMNIFFATLITILYILIFLFFSNSITEPLEKLKVATENLKKGKFRTYLDLKTGDEFEEMANTFNQTTKALGRLDEEHKEIEKAKTKFLSITSHELRSPMTPMKAQLQMLNEGYFGKLTKEQKDAIDIVIRNTNHLDQIIVDFLEISRIEAARLKFHFIKTDLTKPIQDLMKNMKVFMPEKNIKLITKIHKLPLIQIDPDRVMQVLRNLVNNAIKFTEPAGFVKVTVRPLKDKILFSVKDNGIGIEEDKQRKLFEPFYQGEESMYRKYGGTGLGLAICKGIVESQNGKIWFTSKRGEGTTFYFTFPMKPVKQIKPIKLLFSGQESLETKVSVIFREELGPIGKTEFKRFKEMHKFTKTNLFKYIDTLIDSKIITQQKADLFKFKISEVFGDKYKLKEVIPEKNIESFFSKK